MDAAPLYPTQNHTVSETAFTTLGTTSPPGGLGVVWGGGREKTMVVATGRVQRATRVTEADRAYGGSDLPDRHVLSDVACRACGTQRH